MYYLSQHILHGNYNAYYTSKFANRPHSIQEYINVLCEFEIETVVGDFGVKLLNNT